MLKVPYEDWWQAIVTSRIDGVEGLFVHPVQDPAVMAGNGTIGLEILEDLPDPDAVVIPVGGGGLTVGIASAIKALAPADQDLHRRARDRRRAARGAGRRRRRPTWTTRHRSSTGPGAGACWTRCGRCLAPLVDDAFAVSLADTRAAVRTIAERVRVIAEGAGALATAAALAGHAGGGKVVCIVSGGNINLATLAEILEGER